MTHYRAALTHFVVILYEALRARAKGHRRSITAEVLALLEENIPTQKELKARQNFLRQVEKMRSRKTPSSGAFLFD